MCIESRGGGILIEIMNVDLWYLATVLVVILISMTLHEAMHGFVAYWLGDDTAKRSGRLTINPIKHIDPFMTILLPLTLALFGLPVFGGAKPVPFNPSRVRYGEFGAALVGIAGPITNLILAFLSFSILVLVGLPSTNTVLGMILVTSVMVNLGFFAFNILPIPPLDGSRVLYAIAPNAVRRVMEQIERYGTLLVFVIVLLFSGAISSLMGKIISLMLQLFASLFGVKMV